MVDPHEFAPMFGQAPHVRHAAGESWLPENAFIRLLGPITAREYLAYERNNEVFYAKPSDTELIKELSGKICRLTMLIEGLYEEFGVAEIPPLPSTGK